MYYRKEQQTSMKHYKKLLAILLTAMLALGLFAPLAHAAPEGDATIVLTGWHTGILQVLAGFWQPLPVPFWNEASDGAVAYCLDSDLDSPDGDGYSMTGDLFSEDVQRGIRAILLHGYPNDCGGLTETEARYATQTAIWSSMYEAGRVGYNFYARNRLRPAAGNQAVYDYYLSLLNYAWAGDEHIDGSVSTSVATLAHNGSGQLEGTATITIHGYQGYRIDGSKLPPGVTAVGNTYLDGDTITVTAPMRYMGQTVEIQDAIVLLDTRSTANVFWFEPDNSNKQRMVVYSYEFQDVFTSNLVFTSEVMEGALRIRKSVSDGSSPAGFQFELHDGSGVLIGTFTTDVSGVIDIPNLAAGPYSVVEINIPAG
jgi:TQXA domain-containing protein